MGLFGDKLRDAVESAQAITPEVVTVEPASRLESLVVDPRSGENRNRTDYAGTIWFGGRPEVHGRHSVPGANSEIAAPVAVPDSHAYRPEAAGEVQLQAAAAIQGGQVSSAGGTFQILSAEAALGDHPDGGGALGISLKLTALATLPLGVAYRVVVVCDPAAVS